MAYQKFPTSKQLLQDLNSNKLDKIYLFIGEEEGEKEKLINRIIDMAIKDPGDKVYSTRRFHIDNDEFFEAVEFAMTGSMFSEHKVCVMLNINSIKPRDENKTLLSELIENLPEHNTLIITSPENKIPSVLIPAAGKDLKGIKIIQFWRYFDNDIASYAVNSIKKKGLEIERTAVNYLITLTGRDIKKIDEAIETIVSAGEKSVTAAVIKEYINDDKDVSAFEFIDKLFQKKDEAFFHLSKVLDSGTHELALLKLVMRQAELIEKYIYLANNNENIDAAAQEIGINPRNKKNFIDCANSFSSESIKSVFHLIHRADQRIKTGNYSENLASNPIFELVTDMILGASI